MGLQRRGRAARVADSRLYRRHYFVITKTEGLKAPGYSYSRLPDVFSLIVHLFVATNMWTQKTEGLKAPGYSNPRLPDVFVQHFRLTFIAHYHVILNLFQDLSAEMNKKGSQ